MAYSTKIWAKVKADYLTGNFSYDDLSEKYRISEPCIRKHSKSGGWVKGELKEKIEEKIEESTIEAFARLGLTKDKILQKINDGLEADKVVITGGKDNAFAEVIPDHQAIDKYITQYNKMTGNYAAEKQEIKQETDIKIGREDLKELSPEELQVMLKMIDKLGGE